ncbi:MAG: HAD family hydrolase [Duncaniella sp.]|nr:HAD family hydrolase [Duncaniella sp.]
MAHLYISDLDGTLLDSSTQVSKRSASLINEAIGRGALFTVATARTPATVEILLKDIDLSLPAIVMTGAAMWDHRTSRYVGERLIDDELSRKAVAIFREAGLEPFMYCINGNMLDVYHHGPLTREEQAFVDARSGLKLKEFHLDSSLLQVEQAEGVILIFGMGDNELLSHIAGNLDPDRYSVSFYEDNVSTLYYIEVFAAGVSKAAAVERLAAMTGADEITVYGDNLNDISMMSVATDPVAVANAKPPVMTAAARKIASNDDDAVALDVAANFLSHEQ